MSSQRLGVEPLAERGRPGDVREDDGDVLARLGCARSPVERGAACAAEARVRVVLARRRGRSCDGPYARRCRIDRQPTAA